MTGLLIRAGAAVDHANDLGVTPLWLAGENGSAAMAERLLKAGANPNVALPSGQTPLMVAARSGNEQLVKLLVAAGADVNAKEKRQGQTALMWAASQKQTGVVQVLIESGADVRARTREWLEYVQYAGGAILGVLGGEIELPRHRNGGYTPLGFRPDRATLKLPGSCSPHDFRSEAALGRAASVGALSQRRRRQSG